MDKIRERYPDVAFFGNLDLYLIHADVKIGIKTELRNNIELRCGVVIGEDCYIDSGVICTGDAIIGNNVILRNYVVVARGCEIGDNTFISPGVMFNNLDINKNSIGGAKIGKNCFIGAHAVLKEGIEVCDNVIIGACSLVTKDITEPGTYTGIPAKKVK